jgi:hypothetical protein
VPTAEGRSKYFPVQDTKAMWLSADKHRSFLTSALDEGGGRRHYPIQFLEKFPDYERDIRRLCGF